MRLQGRVAIVTGASKGIGAGEGPNSDEPGT